MSEQNDLYQRAAEEFGAALGRLTRGYEADPDQRRDLLQDIHLALWRSFERFNAQCSLRTWVYRVAHNTAITWITRRKRAGLSRLVSVEEIGATPIPPDADRPRSAGKTYADGSETKPIDREVILAYLEGLDAQAIAELTGLSAGNVATKVHRIKNLLAREFNEAERNAG